MEQLGTEKTVFTKQPSVLFRFNRTKGKDYSKLGSNHSHLCAVQERHTSPNDLERGESLASSAFDPTIRTWGWEEIKEWTERTFDEGICEMVQGVFESHDVQRGCVLLRLEEEHLKEMGLNKVGSRLIVLEAIEELRRLAGVVDRQRYTDIEALIDQLDSIRIKKHLECFPKRVILIRHGESQGNVNKSMYANVPDCKLQLTPKGIEQAREAGKELQALVGNESVCFYVSPFVRSRETHKYLREGFHDEQVLYYREDPRIREQEWGNFQDPGEMEKVMEERREIGAFFYRFPTGESGADVFDRVSTFLETLYRDMQKGLCGENAIIVSHGLFCRLFLTRFYHWPVEKFHKLWNFRNCEFAIMELQPQGYYRLISDLRSD